MILQNHESRFVICLAAAIAVNVAVVAAGLVVAGVLKVSIFKDAEKNPDHYWFALGYVWKRRRGEYQMRNDAICFKGDWSV